MRDVSALHKRLEQLGFSQDEATIFMQLLDAPKTQLGISRATGIARSNVYRIVDGMVAKGLVCELASENDKLLVGANTEALELLVIERELQAQTARTDLNMLLPLLNGFQNPEKNFVMKTYRGVAGLKQMLWNELKTKSEILVFSGASINVATGKQWAEKYRLEVIGRGLRLRGIENTGINSLPVSTHPPYIDHYHARYISKDVLDIQFELSIHDNTISLYNSLAHDVRLGTEIVNPFLATFMRQIFEQYWSLASD